MNIGLNLLHAMPEIGGGWNYIQDIIQALQKHDHFRQYYAFVTKKSEELVQDQENWRKILVNVDAENRGKRVLYENVVLPYRAKNRRLQCVHWFANVQGLNRTVPSVVSIFDLQIFRKDNKYAFTKKMYLFLMYAWTIRYARMLLPMSESTLEELRKRFKRPFKNAVIIPPLIHERFHVYSDIDVLEFRKRYSLPAKFWIYVAHFYDHKNHARLIAALKLLKENGFTPWPLVLRGDKLESSCAEEVVRKNLGKGVILLPRLSSDILPLLYASATGLVFPSLYEGGGIPIREAMACGCPILGSDIPAVREFAGDAACYFNPKEIESIAKQIKGFQQNRELRQSVKNNGFRRNANYSTESIIKRLTNAYESVCNPKLQYGEKY